MLDQRDAGYGLLAMAIWALVVVLVVVTVLRFVRHQQATNDTTPTPLDIAKARYAKGEIDKSEYDQLVKDLK